MIPVLRHFLKKTTVSLKASDYGAEFQITQHFKYNDFSGDVNASFVINEFKVVDLVVSVNDRLIKSVVLPKEEAEERMAVATETSHTGGLGTVTDSTFDLKLSNLPHSGNLTLITRLVTPITVLHDRVVVPLPPCVRNTDCTFDVFFHSNELKLAPFKQFAKNASKSGSLEYAYELDEINNIAHMSFHKFENDEVSPFYPLGRAKRISAPSSIDVPYFPQEFIFYIQIEKYNLENKNVKATVEPLDSNVSSLQLATGASCLISVPYIPRPSPVISSSTSIDLTLAAFLQIDQENPVIPANRSLTPEERQKYDNLKTERIKKECEDFLKYWTQVVAGIIRTNNCRLSSMSSNSHLTIQAINFFINGIPLSAFSLPPQDLLALFEDTPLMMSRLLTVYHNSTISSSTLGMILRNIHVRTALTPSQTREETRREVVICLPDEIQDKLRCLSEFVLPINPFDTNEIDKTLTSATVLRATSRTRVHFWVPSSFFPKVMMKFADEQQVAPRTRAFAEYLSAIQKIARAAHGEVICEANNISDALINGSSSLLNDALSLEPILISKISSSLSSSHHGDAAHPKVTSPSVTDERDNNSRVSASATGESATGYHINPLDVQTFNLACSEEITKFGDIEDMLRQDLDVSKAANARLVAGLLDKSKCEPQEYVNFKSTISKMFAPLAVEGEPSSISDSGLVSSDLMVIGTAPRFLYVPRTFPSSINILSAFPLSSAHSISFQFLGSSTPFNVSISTLTPVPDCELLRTFWASLQDSMLHPLRPVSTCEAPAPPAPIVSPSGSISVSGWVVVPSDGDFEDLDSLSRDEDIDLSVASDVDENLDLTEEKTGRKDSPLGSDILSINMSALGSKLGVQVGLVFPLYAAFNQWKKTSTTSLAEAAKELESAVFDALDNTSKTYLHSLLANESTESKKLNLFSNLLSRFALVLSPNTFFRLTHTVLSAAASRNSSYTVPSSNEKELEACLVRVSTASAVLCPLTAVFATKLYETVANVRDSHNSDDVLIQKLKLSLVNTFTDSKTTINHVELISSALQSVSESHCHLLQALLSPSNHHASSFPSVSVSAEVLSAVVISFLGLNPEIISSALPSLAPYTNGDDKSYIRSLILRSILRSTRANNARLISPLVPSPHRALKSRMCVAMCTNDSSSANSIEHSYGGAMARNILHQAPVRMLRAAAASYAPPPPPPPASILAAPAAPVAQAYHFAMAERSASKQIMKKKNMREVEEERCDEYNDYDERDCSILRRHHQHSVNDYEFQPVLNKWLLCPNELNYPYLDRFSESNSDRKARNQEQLGDTVGSISQNLLHLVRNNLQSHMLVKKREATHQVSESSISRISDLSNSLLNHATYLQIEDLETANLDIITTANGLARYKWNLVIRNDSRVQHTLRLSLPHAATHTQTNFIESLRATLFVDAPSGSPAANPRTLFTKGHSPLLVFHPKDHPTKSSLPLATIITNVEYIQRNHAVLVVKIPARSCMRVDFVAVEKLLVLSNGLDMQVRIPGLFSQDLGDKEPFQKIDPLAVSLSVKVARGTANHLTHASLAYAALPKEVSVPLVANPRREMAANALANVGVDALLPKDFEVANEADGSLLLKSNVTILGTDMIWTVRRDTPLAACIVSDVLSLPKFGDVRTILFGGVGAVSINNSIRESANSKSLIIQLPTFHNDLKFAKLTVLAAMSRIPYSRAAPVYLMRSSIVLPNDPVSALLLQNDAFSVDTCISLNMIGLAAFPQILLSASDKVCAVNPNPLSNRFVTVRLEAAGDLAEQRIYRGMMFPSQTLSLVKSGLSSSTEGHSFSAFSNEIAAQNTIFSPHANIYISSHEIKPPVRNAKVDNKKHKNLHDSAGLPSALAGWRARQVAANSQTIVTAVRACLYTTVEKVNAAPQTLSWLTSKDSSLAISGVLAQSLSETPLFGVASNGALIVSAKSTPPKDATHLMLSSPAGNIIYPLVAPTIDEDLLFKGAASVVGLVDLMRQAHKDLAFCNQESTEVELSKKRRKWSDAIYDLLQTSTAAVGGISMTALDKFGYDMMESTSVQFLDQSYCDVEAECNDMLNKVKLEYKSQFLNVEKRVFFGKFLDVFEIIKDTTKHNSYNSKTVDSVLIAELVRSHLDTLREETGNGIELLPSHQNIDPQQQHEGRTTQYSTYQVDDKTKSLIDEALIFIKAQVDNLDVKEVVSDNEE